MFFQTGAYEAGSYKQAVATASSASSPPQAGGTGRTRAGAALICITPMKLVAPQSSLGGGGCQLAHAGRLGCEAAHSRVSPPRMRLWLYSFYVFILENSNLIEKDRA